MRSNATDSFTSSHLTRFGRVAIGVQATSVSRIRIQARELGAYTKMKTWRQGLLLLLPFLLAGLFATTALGDEGDPPARVARLSVAQGKVSFQPSGETTWSEASVNRPVTTGDRLYTDPGASAELEVGSFAVRLSGSTDVTLANLNDQIMQLGVGQGSMRVTVYQMPPNNSVEVDTPNGALMLQSPGSYRVDTAADGNSTQVTVNAGSLQITAGDLSKDLQSGQAVTLRGTGPVTAEDASLPPPDDFDKWCAGRDRRVENSPSVKSVGQSVPGDEDLDNHGVWTEKPDYGTVWVPANVPPGWAPYRYGHWVFIEPGAGRGWKMSRGVMLRSITAAGRTSDRCGSGFRVGWCGPYTLPRWWLLWAGRALASGSACRRGFRWVPASPTTRGTIIVRTISGKLTWST